MNKLILSLLIIPTSVFANKVNITNNANETIVVEITWQGSSTPVKLLVPSKGQANPSSKNCLSLIRIWLGVTSAPVQQNVGGIPINLPENIGKKSIYTNVASPSTKKNQPCYYQFTVNNDGTVTPKI